MLGKLPGVGDVPVRIVLRSEVRLSIAFIADAPVPDMKRFREAVRHTQISVIGAGFPVAVFHPVRGLLRSAAGHVDAQHGLRAELSAVRDKLDGPEGVVIDPAPDEISALPAIRQSPDPVHPVIDAGIGSARETQERGLEAFCLFQDILTDAGRIGSGTARV